MMIAAPTTSTKVEDVGHFSADSERQKEPNSDDEQLDDTPFLSHQLSDDQESFSEKFLRNILTHDYQNLMPRRREKFVEITKTVTVTEIVNGAPDKHPSTCEVKVTNVSPAGPHPVNVSIKHLHEKWHSCDELDKSDDGRDLGKGTVIRIHETHKPFNYTQKKPQQSTKFVFEDVVNSKMETSTSPRQPPPKNTPLFNKSSDNIIDLEFRHPVLIETSERKAENGTNGTRRRFADLRKRVSTTTKTSVTETEKVTTTTRRSSSAHSTSSRRSYNAPKVHTLYYRKFVDEETKNGDQYDDSSDSGSVIIHRDSVTRRSRSADPIQKEHSSTISPIAPPRKRLGREESLHYYRDDDEIIEEKTRRVTVKSPEPGNTSVSMNDTSEGRNITAGITSISMNDSCTDTSYESRFSTIPRARSSPPVVQNIHVNIIGPIETPDSARRAHRIAGRVGEDVTMDIHIEKRRRSVSSSKSRRRSQDVLGSSDAPPKPPRRSKYEEHSTRIGDPLATSTPMTTIERKHTREESEHSSRKSTRCTRPPDINIIECESFIRETRSPARTPATPIVVINQTPSSRRGSQDLLSDSGQRRRKSTVTDIDWYAAFNMKDPSSPTRLARPPFATHGDERKTSKDVRRRASDSSMIGIPPADIDLNQIFSCTVPPEIKKDEKCQCNACRLIRMSEAERASRMERSTRSRQSRSFTKTTEYETRSSTLPSRQRTSPVHIQLDEIFNPKPRSSTKPPTPPSRHRAASSQAQSSTVDESSLLVTHSIDRNQVTPVTNRDSGTQLHDISRNQLLTLSVDQMIQDANDWENQQNRKASISSVSSSTTPKARRASVTRRISVDELTKPEKKKSRGAVPLPPSHVTIDDIFTALSPMEPERKTFIVTRKQRAQDVDAIDFDKNREHPVAPPRTKKEDYSETSTASVILATNRREPDVMSTAVIQMRPTDQSSNDAEQKENRTSAVSIDLDQVFAQGTGSPKDTEETDEKIRRGIAEFEKSKQEKESQRTGFTSDAHSHRRTDIEDSNISMDDVFNPENTRIEVEIPSEEPTVTSTASAFLTPAVGESEEAAITTDSLDVLILQKTGEEKEKEVLKTIHNSSSIGDVFPAEQDQMDGQKEPAISTTATIQLEPSGRFSEEKMIDLNDVFTQGTTTVNTKDSEEDEKIRRRVEEFERSQIEKQAQRTGIVEDSQTGRRTLVDSNISMEDIFDSRKKQDVPVEIPEKTSSASIRMSPSEEPPEHLTSAVSIDLDKVFVEGSSGIPMDDEKNEKIRRRMAEFQKTIQEKESQKSTVVETSHSTRRMLEDSEISMDDVFNPEKKKQRIEVEIPFESSTREVSSAALQMESHQEEREFSETDPASLDLDKIFVSGPTQRSKDDDEEEKIRRRVAEFEKAQRDKESQKSTVVETSHSTQRILEVSDISMDDVFSSGKKTEAAVEPHGASQLEEEEKKITQRIAEFERAEEEKEVQKRLVVQYDHTHEKLFEDSNISIDVVFSTAHEKSEPVMVGKSVVDEEEKRIERRIEEFNRTEEEKHQHLTTTSTSATTHEKLFDDSNISMDDVFGSRRNIEIVGAPHGSSELEKEEQKISQRIAEFERAEAEKEVQKTAIVPEIHTHEKLFEESSISMDDVFNTSHGSPKVIHKSEIEKEESRMEKRIEEFNRTEEEKHQHLEITSTSATTHEKLFDDSNISMDEVFQPEAKRAPATSDVSMDDVFSSGKPMVPSGVSELEEEEKKISQRIAEFERAEEEKEVQKTLVVQEEHTHEKIFDDSNISMDDVISTAREKSESVMVAKSDVDKEEERIERRIEEFNRAEEEKHQHLTTTSTSKSTHEKLFEDSNISMDDVFGFGNMKEVTPSSETTHGGSQEIVSSAKISLDEVFVELPKDSKGGKQEDDEKSEKRIEQFERSHSKKETQRTIIPLDQSSSERILDSSDQRSIEVEIPHETTDVTSTSTIRMRPSEEQEPSSVEVEESIDLSKIFVEREGALKTSGSDISDEKIRRGIAEFERAKQEKEDQRSGVTKTPQSSRVILDESTISMDDVFNTSSASIRLDETASGDRDWSKPTFEDSSISLEEIFKRTSTTTTTTTEKTDTISRRTVSTLDDMFGPQTATPPVISVSSVNFDLGPNAESSSSLAPSQDKKPPRSQNLTALAVPGQWNESMMSSASTISLESFNNSFDPKMRKPLTLPVDNWIDGIVATATNEATKEAPKTPVSFRSPTRISQEIKYEWVADMLGSNEPPKEEHQSGEEHHQKQDDTWISSVVYRPTSETRAYTLRASQADIELPKNEVIDMNKVFEECLRKKDEEECECSACRVTEEELEKEKKRRIESKKSTREEKEVVTTETKRYTSTLSPSEISIEAVFNPKVPLHIQTSHMPEPSTSSPPFESTRTYFISPKVSETVTTTHQWKDADISMDEIFSPVSSSATNENRRFSNFYEDRSGWDTIGSEDSGVMSGGDRGRRRSTRITDHVIDEAFKDIFESQPSTSQGATKTETQYDDYYITSLNQEEADAGDSDVDGHNLDVSQFVDDILGRSMDEAAFLSSTKSLKDHTDTSIDRKKSTDKIHSYYRTRTDTSIDRRSKPEVINEDSETQESQSTDEFLKLIFVDPSASTISKSEFRKSLGRNKSFTEPANDELLEIEIKPEYFLIRGSYSLLIPKGEPLGQMLQKLKDQHDSLATLDFSVTKKLRKLLINCIREKAEGLDMASTSKKYEGLSSRGQSLIESIDHASATFLKMNEDKFDPTRNPKGIVNFCTAENNICTPLLEERFKHLELFFPNIEHLVRYPPAGGWPEAREVLVKYFKEFMGARVSIDELVLTASTRTGYDVTSYCLFEQDDVLLTNGPVYAGTISNVQEKAQCKVECVPTDLSNPRIDLKKYEEELNRQIELDRVVSGVIIVNPHNPLGVTFPPEDVVNLCNWAASKNLKVVIDEVFANCVFDKINSKFRPFLSYRHRVHHPENVAWLWSVSKDFGLPGLKFAVIHSASEGLRKAATKLQMYYPCSPFVQTFAVNLLSDFEWLREFHTKVTRRMAIHYRYTAENLKRLEIPFVAAQAGIFVFADFSKHLSDINEAGELELFERVARAGVMLTPGVHQKSHVFGWFRIVFACSKEELEEGFRRLYVHFGSHLHPVGTVQY